MSYPTSPNTVVPFYSPHPVGQGDIGRQFDEHARSIREIIDFLGEIVRDDGRLKNAAIGLEQLDPAISKSLAGKAEAALAQLLEQVSVFARETALARNEALEARNQARAALSRVEKLAEAAQAAKDAAVQLGEDIRPRLEALEAQPRDSGTNPAAGVLGYYAGGPWGVDALGASATAQDWAQVSIDWAEHMPDPIPPNTLAMTAVTGDHWSSRWWANRAASAFGMMAWWYQGAYPSPGPPTDPTGQPLPPGAMYWDTTLNQMMVWNGQAWVPLGVPAPGVVSSLFYKATANQTVFPLTTGDLYGHSFPLQTGNGIEAFLNGVRLTPDDGTGTLGDYTVNIATSTVTLVKGAQAGFIVAFDVLVNPAQLAPGAPVAVHRINPITPDGTTTTFTLTCSDGTTMAMRNPFELLVSIDGVVQEPQAQYQVTANTITFTQAPTADAYIFMRWFMTTG